MNNTQILNTLSDTKNMIAYIEKVKETFLKEAKLKLNLKQIKVYMENFVEKNGANWFYKNMILNAIDCYYEENGEIRKFK